MLGRRGGHSYGRLLSRKRTHRATASSVSGFSARRPRSRYTKTSSYNDQPASPIATSASLVGPIQPHTVELRVGEAATRQPTELHRQCVTSSAINHLTPA